MLVAERRDRIVELVQTSGAMSTEDLAVAVGVSIETIRRDMLALERHGVITRVHGGATIRRSEVSSESSFDVRRTAELAAKQRIARVAAGLVPEGGLVMIDVGSTALLAARALPETLSVTVVTTSLRVAVELSERPGVEIVIAGGRLRSGDLAISGLKTVHTLADMHFDVALLGSGGIHAEAGLTDYYLDEAEYRQVVIARTSASYVLCDATKFDKIARYSVAPLGGFSSLIVDKAPSAELRSAILDAGSELTVAV